MENGSLDQLDYLLVGVGSVLDPFIAQFLGSTLAQINVIQLFISTSVMLS